MRLSMTVSLYRDWGDQWWWGRLGGQSGTPRPRADRCMPGACCAVTSIFTL